MFSMFNMHVRACIHACMCACVCVCMHGTPPTLIPTPSPIHHPPQGGGPPESLKIR